MSPDSPSSETGRPAERSWRERLPGFRPYRYLPRDQNQLAPICVAESWPWLAEQYGPSWALPFLPGWAAAYANLGFQHLRNAFEKAVFRFDSLDAHRQLFRGRVPLFAEEWNNDQHFAYRRIAGPNALSLRRAEDRQALRAAIDLDLPRVDARFRDALGRRFSLAAEADEGRVYLVDYPILREALRPGDRNRDTRWRQKYLPISVGVFLECPEYFRRLSAEDQAASELVPIAIQTEGFEPSSDRNPIHYPDDGWAWTIAKLYLEVADHNFHAGCGHVYRTHFAMNPFCMATPRQLSRNHPIFALLRPHTRFTLAANGAAYRFFTERRNAYFKFYAGTLEETRRIAILACEQRSFPELALEADLESRGVAAHLRVYPYRDDARLWLRPIRDFVQTYVDACYPDDARLAEDTELRAWAEEIAHPARGGVRQLVPGDRLDSKAKLVDLLAQVLFIAGPGHASQHFSEMYYYRYALAFPDSAYAPPAWQPERAHEARFRNALPPIRTAGLHFTYSRFGDFRYHRFGDYRRYPLRRRPEAQEAIPKLQLALAEVEVVIEQQSAGRLLPYDFLKPSRVPNSINI